MLNQKPLVVALIISVLITVGYIVTPKVFAQSTNSVRIINDFSYINIIGRLHILAEVINDSDKPITDIKLNV